MKPAAFDYLRPDGLDHAVRLLADADGAALPISGGQSLLVLMGLRLTMLEAVVDVSRLPELREVHDHSDHVEIGALTTHAAIEDGAVPDASNGLMARVASKIAYRAVRHRGTIGGSVALADPAADWPACLIALGAEVRIAGPDGERAVAAADFVVGAYETVLAPGEIITGFRIPRRPGLRWGTSKVSRKSGAFADSMAVYVEAVDDQTPRVALAGTSSHVRVLPRAGVYAKDHKVLDAAELRAVIVEDLADIAPDADAYQQRCHVATVTRAMMEARQP